MNCARIIHGNQVATNGVVHVIDRVISTVGNTIQNVLDVEEDVSTLSVSMNGAKAKQTLTSYLNLCVPFQYIPSRRIVDQ